MKFLCKAVRVALAVALLVGLLLFLYARSNSHVLDGPIMRVLHSPAGRRLPYFARYVLVGRNHMRAHEMISDGKGMREAGVPLTKEAIAERIVRPGEPLRRSRRPLLSLGSPRVDAGARKPPTSTSLPSKQHRVPGAAPLPPRGCKSGFVFLLMLRVVDCLVGTVWRAASGWCVVG